MKKKICARQLAIIANAIAVAISDGLTPSDIEVLGAIFSLMGDTLALIASQLEENSEGNTSSSQDTNSNDLTVKKQTINNT